MPGLVSTLLNQAYSMPSRLVHTFLQVTEQVWHPMHLSRFSTMAICARIFMCVSLVSFPLPIVLHDGERVRVRGSSLLRRLLPPLTPTLSPQTGRGSRASAGRASRPWPSCA